MRRKRRQSAYVRRKNAKKGCPGCGGHRVEAAVNGWAVWFCCRSCRGTWAPGLLPWESGEDRSRRLYGVSLT